MADSLAVEGPPVQFADATAASARSHCIDPDAYLKRFPKELLLCSEGRRKICELDPLAFALIYFRDSLRSDATGGVITLSDFHVDIANAARRWAKRNIGPMEIREAWVAPRESGKSTWMFLILPAWALAFGHRKMIVAFADNADLATNHLASFKRKVQTELPLLRRDFPDLCRPKLRPGGMTDSDRQNLYLARSGVAFMARGIESTTLGTKVGDNRPDLLLFDDVEPPAATYSPGQKDGRLATIRDAILPMNLNAVVEFVGTVTMDGSIMHDIVRQAIEPAETAPAWVSAEAVVTHYYPALITGDGGVERSLWPARWGTDFLLDLRQRSPRVFALNYQNQPVPLSSSYWTPGMWSYGRVAGLTKHIISIDPAVTTSRNADFTGIAVMSYSPFEKRAILRHTEQVKLPPSELRQHVLRLLASYPEVRMLLVEANQGGDTWQTVFHDLPPQVVMKTIHQTEKKELRWAQVLDYWTSGWVVHEEGGQTGPFERQAIAVPKSANDDICDAVSSGIRWMKKAFEPANVHHPDRVMSYV